MPTLDWIGKDAVIRHHKEVPFRLLEPDPKLSHGDPGEGNLIVQGDNLHALKALLPKYAGRVKCIYIDPPYNTGNEGWVYNDNVNSPEILKWLGQTVGKEAEDLSRHDKWLCMMYPRLVLLREFLADDGLLFVAHDDNECASLRLLLDEVFGRNQHVATFVWNSSGHTDNQLEVKVNHEYIACFSRKRKNLRIANLIDPNTREDSNLWDNRAENSITKNGPGNPASYIDLPEGFPFRGDSLELEPSSFPSDLLSWMESDRPSSSTIKRKYPSDRIEFPLRMDRMLCNDGRLQAPCRVYSGWANARKLQLFIDNGCSPLIEDDGAELTFYLSGRGVIYYEKIKPSAHNVVSVLRNFGTTEKMRGTLEGMGIHFSYPKPVRLVQYLIRLASEKDSIILDSFAGSGTTAHAVLKQNAEDGGSRKFILVEMEPSIAEDITAKRVKQVAQGYTDAKGNSVEGLGGGFQFCSMSDEPLFNEFGDIRDDVTFAQLADFVWFSEVGTGYTGKGDSPLLGVHEGRAIYLLFNGILGDRRPQGGNILTNAILEALPPHDGPKIIYAAATKLGAGALQRANVIFKQTPYAIEV